LKEVDVLSTISGGSITGAAFCLWAADYSAHLKHAAAHFVKQKDKIKPNLSATGGRKPCYPFPTAQCVGVLAWLINAII
jgi:hypothetical protein